MYIRWEKESAVCRLHFFRVKYLFTPTKECDFCRIRYIGCLHSYSRLDLRLRAHSAFSIIEWFPATAATKFIRGFSTFKSIRCVCLNFIVFECDSNNERAIFTRHSETREHSARLFTSNKLSWYNFYCTWRFNWSDPIIVRLFRFARLRAASDGLKIKKRTSKFFISWSADALSRSSSSSRELEIDQDQVSLIIRQSCKRFSHLSVLLESFTAARLAHTPLGAPKKKVN